MGPNSGTLTQPYYDSLWVHVEWHHYLLITLQLRQNDYREVDRLRKAFLLLNYIGLESINRFVGVSMANAFDEETAGAYHII